MDGETQHMVRPWWESRPFVAMLILLSALPLMYPHNPPLVDLFGHMGRFRVELDLAHSPWLQRYYNYHWAPIGNLGVDILVIPFAKLFGLELGVKLIVLMIPALMAAGFLWVAREVHGRLPPTVLFALPFVYSHPFMFGFVNYCLSMALAFLAFGLWLRLGRLNRTGVRAALFLPISFVVFFTHTFGWGTLGLLCFSAEAVRQHDRGVGWLRAGPWAALHASVMALPALLILYWRSSVPGSETRGWFLWKLKWEPIITVLRDRWLMFDWLSIGAITAIILFAIVSRRLRLSRNLAFSAIVLFATFMLLPRMIFASAYADMRLAPFVFAVAVLAIRFKGDTPYAMGEKIAVLGMVFFLFRIVSHTVSFAIADDDAQAKMTALDHVPLGSRVVSLVSRPCGNDWSLGRESHLGAMVMVRRQGFSNDQWITAGVNLLELKNHDAGIFSSDPSEIVRPNGCWRSAWWIDRALRLLPRDVVDYVWLIDPAPFDPTLVAGMREVWRGPHSVLYQVRP